jgi:hypothetical protein
VRYFVVDLVQTDSGRCPALADGASFSELAGPRFAGFGLYRVVLEEEQLTPQIVPVPRTLQYLLDSGQAFPPSLALARVQVERDFREQTPSRGEFLARYAELLRSALEWQPSSGYFLAESRVEEAGYLDEGDFVWIVGSDATNVSWISADAFVYSNPRDHFRLDPEVLARIRPWRAPPFGVLRP